MKKSKATSRTCADCIHEYQCQMWNVGTIHNMDASNCTCYETVKDSAAYLCWVLDERRKKRTNADRIRGMSDEELAAFIDEVSGYQADYLQYKGEFIDAGDVLAWLRQPAEEVRRWKES